MHRVVVTGLGAISPFGVGVQCLWNGLVDQLSGIRKLAGEEWEGIPCRIAGTVPVGEQDQGFVAEQKFTKADLRNMSLATLYGLVAVEEALTQAKLLDLTEQQQDCSGVSIGTGMTVFTDVLNAAENLKQSYRKVNPHFIPKILPNMTAGHASIKYKLKGPCLSPSTACTTGLHAIGDAYRLVRDGVASVMLAGGTETPVNPLSMSGFCRAKALATGHNEKPWEASRPWDKDRNGFVMSEGAAVVVLEELQSALRRDAQIYAEVRGYGLSGDGHHITAPPEDGNGAFRSMVGALKDAAVNRDSVGYINAHATSTPLGDAAEARAIDRLFGDNKLLVSSSKGSLGHLLGAAGSIEFIATCLSCNTAQIPPTMNLSQLDENLPELHYVSHEVCNWKTEHRIALTNSFGFGGANATICISNFVQ